MAADSRLSAEDLKYLRSIEQVLAKKGRDSGLTFAENLDQLKAYFASIQTRLTEVSKEIQHPGRKSVFETQLARNLDQNKRIVEFLNQLISKGVKLGQSRELYEIFMQMLKANDISNSELNTLVTTDKSSMKYQEKMHKIFGKHLENLSSIKQLTEQGVMIKDIHPSAMHDWFARAGERGKEAFVKDVKGLFETFGVAFFGPVFSVWEEIRDLFYGVFKGLGAIIGWFRGRKNIGQVLTPGIEGMDKRPFADGMEEYFNRRAMKSPFWKRILDKLGVKVGQHGLGGILGGLGDKISGFLAGIGPGILGALKNAWTSVFAPLAQAFSIIGAGLLLGWGLYKMFPKFFEDVNAFIEQGFTRMFELWDAFVGGIKAAWTDAIGYWKSVATEVRDGIIVGWNRFSAGIKKSLGKVSEFGKRTGDVIHNFNLNKFLKESLFSGWKNIQQLTPRIGHPISSRGIHGSVAKPGEVYKSSVIIRDSQSSAVRDLSVNVVKSVSDLSKQLERTLVQQTRRQEDVSSPLHAPSVSDIPVMVDDLGIILLNTGIV